MVRKIAVITGTRAEYGVLRPLLRAIKDSLTLEETLVVSSMHLSEEFGHTIDEIRMDDFNIGATIEDLPAEDSNAAMVSSIGECIKGMATAFKRIEPDIVLVTGDRGEMLAASITAAYMNIPVAHIHGGDVSGSIDDLVRHAITKFAHIHFPATESSARRISQMGEEPHRILKVGALALDSILNMELPEPDELVDRYGVDLDRPIIIVLQHPVTSESDDAEQQIRITLDAIAGADYQTLIIYPNADSGGRRIIEVIREFENRDLINSFESVPHIDFLALMNISSALVGNSSAGIIEAPSFHLPVVNIGSRQSGRERAENIIDVGHDRTEITNAIVKALGDEFRSLAGNCINPYGDGMTSARIIKALTDITIDKSLMSKKYQLGGL